MKKVVMALSGGMDSATLLGLLLEQDYAVHAITFYYGSKHNKWENAATTDLIEYYQRNDAPVIPHFVDISAVMGNFNSNLMLSGGDIPEGHYEDENMRKTVVPGRNMIFASIAAGLAESIGAEKIALGVHSGDHHIYPDCRKEFIKALDSAIYLSSDRSVEVIAPLIDEDKESILRKGLLCSPSVPYELTRTCYKDQIVSCGKCGSCCERLEAFNKLQMPDPIPYEGDVE
jgi:7-cyano-7-deazaguanine synthase